MERGRSQSWQQRPLQHVSVSRGWAMLTSGSALLDSAHILRGCIYCKDRAVTYITSRSPSWTSLHVSSLPFRVRLPRLSLTRQFDPRLNDLVSSVLNKMLSVVKALHDSPLSHDECKEMSSPLLTHRGRRVTSSPKAPPRSEPCMDCTLCVTLPVIWLVFWRGFWVPFSHHLPSGSHPWLNLCLLILSTGLPFRVPPLFRCPVSLMLFQYSLFGTETILCHLNGFYSLCDT